MMSTLPAPIFLLLTQPKIGAFSHGQNPSQKVRIGCFRPGFFLNFQIQSKRPKFPGCHEVTSDTIYITSYHSTLCRISYHTTPAGNIFANKQFGHVVDGCVLCMLFVKPQVKQKNDHENVWPAENICRKIYISCTLHRIIISPYQCATPI